MTTTSFSYLNEIGRIPLLSADEQILLGTAVRRWLDDPEPSPAVIRRGKRAKERMVTANLRLVVAWAKKFRNKGVSFEDLIQEGNIGLIRGVEKYDPSTGYRLSTYAVWWIRQALTKVVANHSTLIRRSSSALAARSKMNTFVAAYQAEHGRQPSWAEIAAAVGSPEASLRGRLDAVARAEQMMSLDAKVKGGDDFSTYAELIAAPGEDRLEQLDQELAWEQVEAVLPQLTQHEQELLMAPAKPRRRTAQQQGAKEKALGRLRRCLEAGPQEPEPLQAFTITRLPAAALALQLQELDLLAA